MTGVRYVLLPKDLRDRERGVGLSNKYPSEQSLQATTRREIPALLPPQISILKSFTITFQENY